LSAKIFVGKTAVWLQVVRRILAEAPICSEIIQKVAHACIDPTRRTQHLHRRKVELPMHHDLPKPLSDARRIGQAARLVRRARNMTAQQVATAMNLPLRTYEYFEAGAGRVNQDYVHRFARATNCDPWSLLVGPPLDSIEFARQTADNKLMMIFLIALGEFVRTMGDRLLTLDPRALIEAFTETFRKLEAENRAMSEETASWLDAVRHRMAGDPPEDDE